MAPLSSAYRTTAADLIAALKAIAASPEHSINRAPKPFEPSIDWLAQEAGSLTNIPTTKELADDDRWDQERFEDAFYCEETGL